MSKWRPWVPVNGLWKERKGKKKGIELLINEGWDWEVWRCSAGSWIPSVGMGGGKMRILEGACPQFLAEEHRKGKWMSPNGKSHFGHGISNGIGKQVGSVRDVEFEGFVMSCPIQGCGEDGILLLEAEAVLAWCGRQNPALPSPALQKGIAHPTFLAENSQPFPVSGTWLWLPSFPSNIPRRGNEFNDSSSTSRHSRLHTLPTSLCTFPRVGMIWESSSPPVGPSGHPLPWGIGAIPLDFPRE